MTGTIVGIPVICRILSRWHVDFIAGVDYERVATLLIAGRRVVRLILSRVVLTYNFGFGVHISPLHCPPELLITIVLPAFLAVKIQPLNRPAPASAGHFSNRHNIGSPSY
jgi:hypothetical protein